MAGKKHKSFLLRTDQETLAAIQRWANDEFRSLNGQIEWLLNEALRKHGRRSSPPEKRGSRG